eukprot:8087428-Pyramimonas_sp.AAC.1
MFSDRGWPPLFQEDFGLAVIHALGSDGHAFKWVNLCSASSCLMPNTGKNKLPIQHAPASTTCTPPDSANILRMSPIQRSRHSFAPGCMSSSAKQEPH